MNPLRQVIATILIVNALIASSFSAEASSRFMEGEYEVVDTGVQQTTLYGPNVLGTWLDNRRLLLNALPEEPDAQQNKRQLIVVFDTRSGSVHTVHSHGSFICRDPGTEILRLIVEGVDRFVRIDESGQMVGVETTPRWKKHRCHTGEPNRPDRLQMFLNDGDGYIDYGKAGGGSSKENAILFRSNQPPVSLPLTGGEVKNAIYISHLNRYLLGDYDYLSGHVRPQQKPVFYLMNPDGDVLEIHQPSQFASKIGEFGTVRFMRDGLILDRSGYRKGSSGLFFLREEKIHRIFGADRQFVRRLLPSPDGCQLAFLSFKDENFDTKKTVKLINLCKGS